MTPPTDPMPSPEQLEAFLDMQSSLIGLEIDPAYREGVLRNLALVAEMARSVMDFPLTPADESGNVFMPVPRASDR